jgi:hypothetical protein
MLVKRKSIFTGVETELELPVTQAQIDRWQNTGALIQDVFPNLTPGQREFLLSGATEEEFDRLFPEDEDDEV